jgi:hypothetical protein
VDSRKPRENSDVQFSATRGDWVMDYKENAQRELDIMLSMRVHVNEHSCHLELEEEDGTFAIVCRDHPPLVSRPQKENPTTS